MKKFFAVVVCVLGVLVFSSLTFAESASFINEEDSNYKVSLLAESGFINVLSHTIQFGQAGTKFDYKTDGNQDVLFPFLRLSAELKLFDEHAFVFLYQPFEVLTKGKTKEDTRFYDVVFPAGTPLDVKYGFSFYRASYVWYFLRGGKNELGLGISMQIRNASIVFASTDGTDVTIQQNVGPVPILKLSGKLFFDNGIWTGIDADGFYASNAIFNGSGYPFVGAIWDVSARAGIELKNNINPFINLRMFGGGGEGTSTSTDAQGDGYTKNWLNTFSLTLGVEFN